MMSKPRIPKYRCFKPRNLGLVVINGQQHYLGPYKSEESLREYHRLVQEYLVQTFAPAPEASDGSPAATLTVVELIAAL